MKNWQRPPDWIGKWLDRYCQRNLAEGIRGDLLEIFEAECETIGPARARRRYIWRALGFLKPVFREKNGINYSTAGTMWKHHFLTSVRSLKRHRQHFIINSLGLAIALSCAILAAIFSTDELSYDSWHSKSDRIHRLYKKYVNPEAGTSIFTAETSGMMGPTITEDFPEVESFVRLRPWWDDVIVSHNERHFVVEEFVFADSSFFRVFDFRLRAGNPATALVQPSSIVLTESLAKKLFGNEEPMGKVVTGIDDHDFLVTGIVEDAPRNSHIQFDALVSWTTTVPGVGPLNYSFLNNWIGQTHYTYLLLHPGANPVALEQKLQPLIGKFLPERAEQYFLRLQPFREVYLSGHEILGSDDMKMGSLRFLKIFVFTGVLVLVIAAFNYINISLAKVSRNVREVGLRKVIGAGKKQIVERYLAETVIQVVVALATATVLVMVLLPYFNEFSGKDIPLAVLADPRLLAGLFIFTLVLSISIGLYPALLMTAGSPVTMLRNAVGTIRVGFIRRVLLVVQYGISIALIVGTVIVYGQTGFLRSQTEGIAADQVIVVNINNEVSEKREAFVNKIKSHPNVLSVANCQAAIGSGSFGTTLFPEGSNSIFNSRLMRVDHAFYETYGIRLVDGTLFRPEVASDSNGLVVNQTFVKEMGWDTGVGKKVKFSQDDTVSYPIIGVVEDFHVLSPAQHKIGPALMYLTQRNRFNVSIRVGGGNVAGTINFLEDTWDEFADKTPFGYYFVSEWYEQQFRAEMQMLASAVTFAAISIILCGLGLYGLTSLMLEQRLREISIRRVMGANAGSLLLLINRQFVLLVAIGFVIAAPLTWLAVNRWLESFPYKISPGPTPFVVAAFFTFLVSVATVSLLTMRASLTNPSKVLRSE